MGPSYEQEQEFILNLGHALIKWQLVEASAYHLFRAFMDMQNEALVSLTFHHIQSFDSRISLLDRCAHFLLQDGDLAIRWNGTKGQSGERGLKSRLEEQAALRNRLVHFKYHPGVQDGQPVIELGPSYFDATYAIKDRWKNPINKIDLARLQQAQIDFKHLASDLSQFQEDFASHIAR